MGKHLFFAVAAITIIISLLTRALADIDHSTIEVTPMKDGSTCAIIDRKYAECDEPKKGKK